MAATKKQNRYGRWRWVLFPAGILIILIALLFVPWNTGNLSYTPHPVQSYTEALQRVQILQESETDQMNPVCRLKFLTHGQKVSRVILFVHGYTTCPQQFQELGNQIYALGWNVLIVPLPHHGLADRMTEEHAQMKAEELTAYADNVVDIAHGLGDQVIMAGFSLGGVTTAWAAQNRSDIDLAVMVSPAFGFKQIPTKLTAPMMNILSILPDRFVWWNPALQLNTPPNYAYPRYSYHGLAQTLRLAFATQAKAMNVAPAARSMVVVTNANDESVNNELTADIVTAWHNHGANLKTYTFDPELNLPHDLIDPDQSERQIELVYPLLIKMITQE